MKNSTTALITLGVTGVVAVMGFNAYQSAQISAQMSSQNNVATDKSALAEMDTARLERLIDQRVNTILESERLVGPQFNDLFAESVVTYSTEQQARLQEEEDVASRSAAGNLPAVTDSDWVLGDRNAPVLLVEYGSYACGFCQRAHPVFHDLVDAYDGQVAWVYRHYPLGVGGNDESQAVAANCAGDLGGNDAFWAFSDALYNDAIFDENTVLAFLNQWGIEPSAMDECTSNADSQIAAVRAQAEGGRGAGVTGTPGNFLIGPNGEIEALPGAQPYTEFQRVIDRMLAGA